MDSKLQMLLDKININHEYYKFFENSKLIKIIGNRERDSYCFYIESDNTIDIDVYDMFISCLRETFKNYKDVNVSFKCSNINYNLLKIQKNYMENILIIHENNHYL